jgi:hypothetical protein
MKIRNDTQILFELKKDLENTWKIYNNFLEKLEKARSCKDYEREILVCYMQKVIDLETQIFELGYKIKEREIMSL